MKRWILGTYRVDIPDPGRRMNDSVVQRTLPFAPRRQFRFHGLADHLDGSPVNRFTCGQPGLADQTQHAVAFSDQYRMSPVVGSMPDRCTSSRFRRRYVFALPQSLFRLLCCGDVRQRTHIFAPDMSCARAKREHFTEPSVPQRCSKTHCLVSAALSKVCGPARSLSRRMTCSSTNFNVITA